MTSNDAKQFLARTTGVPEPRWKRLSKTTTPTGAVQRTFEDRSTGRRVIVQETGTHWSMVSDRAAAETPVAENPVVADSSLAETGHERAFAIVLVEDPTFDDAMDDVLGEHPEMDPSYRWFTTLLLSPAVMRAPRSALQALEQALPAYRVIAPGELTDGMMVFDDLIAVEQRDGDVGPCTGEADRLDVLNTLQAAGWRFYPEMANAYAYGVGEPVPAFPIGPVAAWTPSMPLPTPQGADPGWPARSPSVDHASTQGPGSIARADEDDLQRWREQDIPPIVRALIQAMLDQRRTGLNAETPFSGDRSSLEPSPLEGRAAADENPANVDTTSKARARFSFSFGENTRTPANGWQNEWLEIYDAEDGGYDRHVTEPMAEAGFIVPVGLTEAVEGVFDYKMGSPVWQREDLAMVLIALGLSWDRQDCALAATGFEPSQQRITPWWRAGLTE